MKKALPVIAFLFAILLSFNTLASQGKPINIQGKVIDKSNGELLEYATVTLFNASDSTFVAGIITDSKGQFTLQANEGKYYLTIQFMGYKTKRMNVNVGKNSNEINLGKIYLEQDSALLDEVEVIAEKSTMSMTLDKRVFNVGKDLASTAGNAIEVLENIPSVTVDVIEVLENIPSVTVDVDGNVSLRGDDGVQILVDGKVSGLLGLST